MYQIYQYIKQIKLCSICALYLAKCSIQEFIAIRSCYVHTIQNNSKLNIRKEINK